MHPRFGVAAIAGLLASLTVMADAPAALAQDRVCAKDPNTKVVTCKIVRRADPGGPELAVDIDGPGGLPLVWERRRSNGLPGATFTCEFETTVGTETTQDIGVGWAVFVTNTATGEIRLSAFDCEYPGEDPPEPPPAPPGIDRLVEDQREILALATGLSPSVERRGVSQLATWFWCDGRQATSLDLSLDRYQITAAVDVVSVTWTIDGPDGHIERSASECGAEPPLDSSGTAAAAKWIPNEPGDYTIRLSTTWSGTWALTYSDPTFGAFDLGSFDLGTLAVESAPISYSVYEIQTVGVAP